jgi:hypothetical protein
LAFFEGGREERRERYDDLLFAFFSGDRLAGGRLCAGSSSDEPAFDCIFAAEEDAASPRCSFSRLDDAIGTRAGGAIVSDVILTEAASRSHFAWRASPPGKRPATRAASFGMCGPLERANASRSRRISSAVP